LEGDYSTEVAALKSTLQPPNKTTEEEDSMPKLADQKGKIGYIILWLMGVPASVLILIFLLRGCT